MSGGDAGAATGPGPSGVKRKRTARVTSGQIDALLAKLEARPHLYTRKFAGLQGRENFDEGWKEVTAELNQLPNGSFKSAEQWMTVWRDLMSRACSKASRLRLERVRTGNRAVTIAPLTEVERRIVSLVGGDYTLGTECPDSMPEEFMILNDASVIIHADASEVPGGDASEVPGGDASEVPGADASEVISSLPVTQYFKINDVEEHSGSRAIDTAGVPSPPPPNEVIIMTPRLSPAPQIYLNPRRSVAEQYSTARQDFLAIAASNAESMRMLATAATMQAEAAKLHAEAMKGFADALASAIEKLINK